MSLRLMGLGLVVAIVIILSVALRLEYVEHLIPCYLCILQRIAFFGCGLAGLLLLLLPGLSWRCWVGGTVLALSSLVGLSLASRQIWLQHLPAGQAPACGPGFQYVLQNFPLNDALLMLLSGDGNCATVTWRFLTFSMADYAALCFFVLWIVSVIVFFQIRVKGKKS